MGLRRAAGPARTQTGTARLEEAVAAFRAALEVLETAGAPRYAADVREHREAICAKLMDGARC